jgi:dTDP-4-dehydrorhamnose 3,5-epimerase-like enzyme
VHTPLKLKKRRTKEVSLLEFGTKDELKSHGLNNKLVQASISFSKIKGTLRGLHYQKYPYGEDKLVRVSRGSAYYVIVDLRKKSPTFKGNFSITLSDRKLFNAVCTQRVCIWIYDFRSLH